MITMIVTFLLKIAALFLTLVSLRHLFYMLLAWLRPAPIPTANSEPRTRFTVLIPAHNEESGVGVAIGSARALDYPKELFRIVALADNCSDATKDVARSMGIDVAERRDEKTPGKGNALDWFIASKPWDDDEALVCMDADSIAETNYLRALGAHIARGAEAVQGYNGCKPPASPLAALSVITNTMKNAAMYAGRASLGLPVPLMNGWCLTGRVLREHCWKSYSVAEDFEQTLRLAHEGIYAEFAGEALIRSEKASSFARAESQRRRWSGGQSQIARTLGLPTFREVLRRRSWPMLELALDVLLPGYATLTGLLAFVLIASWAMDARGAVSASLIGLASLVAVGLFGFVKAGASWALVKGLALAPAFIVWKMWLAVSSRVRPPKEWRRADRNPSCDE